MFEFCDLWLNTLLIIWSVTFQYIKLEVYINKNIKCNWMLRILCLSFLKDLHIPMSCLMLIFYPDLIFYWFSKLCMELYYNLCILICMQSVLIFSNFLYFLWLIFFFRNTLFLMILMHINIILFMISVSRLLPCWSLTEFFFFFSNWSNLLILL